MLFAYLPQNSPQFSDPGSQVDHGLSLEGQNVRNHFLKLWCSRNSGSKGRKGGGVCGRVRFFSVVGGKAAGDIIVDVVVGGGSGLGRRASCVRGEESGV